MRRSWWPSGGGRGGVAMDVSVLRTSLEGLGLVELGSCPTCGLQVSFNRNVGCVLPPFYGGSTMTPRRGAKTCNGVRCDPAPAEEMASLVARLEAALDGDAASGAPSASSTQEDYYSDGGDDDDDARPAASSFFEKIGDTASQEPDAAPAAAPSVGSSLQDALLGSGSASEWRTPRSASRRQRPTTTSRGAGASFF